MKSHFLNRFLILCLLCFGWFQNTITAGEITRNQALTIAGKVVMQYFPTERQSLPLSINTSSILKPDELFYACNVGDSGFVLVAKNDNCPPILGFSWESNFPAKSEQVPALMNIVLGNIHNQCEEYASRDTVSQAITDSWQLYSGKKSGSSVQTGTIAPLLATSWNCDSTFFDLFPEDFREGGSVPIAMGQVFRFYGTPNTGIDEICYELIGQGNYCTKLDDFTFNFSRMSNTLGNSAVDSLIYCMSVACYMQPTGASLESYVTSMPDHYGYSKDMRAVECWNYTLADVIHHQLSLRRPVPAEWLNHAFVIDGYFPGNIFHFNVGLGGLYNGYYFLDNSIVKVDTDHSILTCFTDAHPKSLLPGAKDLTAVTEGDSVRVSWTPDFDKTLRDMLVRFVVLRDGLIPIAETTDSTVVLSASAMGGSSKLRVVADFGTNGASELSDPFLYISDQQIANIPSIPLRRLINAQLGSDDQVRQPFVGELELIKDLEIVFADQNGIEKLTKLRDLKIDATDIRVLRDGDYLQNLSRLIFYNCVDFNFTTFDGTRSLIQLFGYDYAPFDLYEFRHNTNLGWFRFSSSGTYPNRLMDLYGADKYFPKLADFYLYHLSAGLSGTYQDCFVSYESYLDVYPKIKSNTNLLAHTKPSSFAPCYPTPARDVNIPEVTNISWQSNFTNANDVFYNVFIGKSRDSLELKSIFQTEKSYSETFEPNRDYYWRIEAYHADSTYYSGIYHFSTWQDLPIPFVDKFDNYYSACPIADESPFWISFNNALTNKAVTNRDTKYAGFYSLELKPQSDAGVLINSPKDSIYYIEFRFLNQGGQVATELLQKSGSSDDNIVNSKIEFLGSGIGLMTYESTSFPFTFINDEWNRVDITLNMNTHVATFSLNGTFLKEWQWNIQMGGTANANLFKGIRLVNNAGSTGGSGFVDNLIIDYKYPFSSAGPVRSQGMELVYLSGNRELVLTGVQSSAIREIALYDLQGRKVMSRQNPDNLMLPISSSVPGGIYVVVVDRKDGQPFSRKITIMK